MYTVLIKKRNSHSAVQLKRIITEITNHFDLRNENVNHHYNLCNHNIFTPNIVVSSTSGERSIQYRGAKLWNNLSDDIRQCESLSIFKKKLKVHLLEDSSLDDSDIYYYY